MNPHAKAIYGLLILLLWAAFAWVGKTDTGGLISAFSAILAGLGLYHFSGRQPSQAPPPAPPSTSAPPPAPPAA